MPLPISLAVSAKAIAAAARRAKLRAAGGAPTPALAGSGGRSKHVVIVGAGVAGMSAALLLRSAGHHATVLEARDRPGGRVFTLRQPFGEGLFAEAGAARIADQHRWTIAWARHFGLQLEPMYPQRGRIVGLHAGRRSDGIDVAHLSSHDLHNLLVGNTAWESQFVSGHARPMLAHTLIKPAWYRIAGGMDRLAQSFARALDGAVTYQAAVEQVTSRATSTRVTYSHHGVTQSVAADYVLCTVPLTTLSQIDFDPPLPEDRRATLRALDRFPALRVYLQVRNRDWLTPGANGYGATDDRLEIWHPTFAGPPGRSLVVLYAQGEAATPFLSVSPEARVRLAVEKMQALFPRLAEHCERTAQFCWNDESWSRGAKAAGTYSAEAMGRPAGRVFFSGDGTSADGWIDGALASSHRAAVDILAHIEASPA